MPSQLQQLILSNNLRRTVLHNNLGAYNPYGQQQPTSYPGGYGAPATYSPTTPPGQSAAYPPGYGAPNANPTTAANPFSGVSYPEVRPLLRRLHNRVRRLPTQDILPDTTEIRRYPIFNRSKAANPASSLPSINRYTPPNAAPDYLPVVNVSTTTAANTPGAAANNAPLQSNDPFAKQQMASAAALATRTGSGTNRNSKTLENMKQQAESA